jgi:3'(2'), 5'-bisphosphate nucleotidase
MYSRELEAARSLSIEAGKIILNIYNSGDFTASSKDDMSPVTEADLKANHHIISGLRMLFPSYSILSEESEDDMSRLDNDYCFLIDPLDGTKEFISRNGQFTVNIALSYKGKIVMGVIYLPAIDELYFASAENGSYMIKNNREIKIGVSGRKTDPRLAVSRSHRTENETIFIEKNNIREVVEAGSSLKGCLVAKGDAEIYCRYGRTMEWDTAAMQIILEEAGGIMKNTDGSDIYYNKKIPENRSFYAANIDLIKNNYFV